MGKTFLLFFVFFLVLTGCKNPIVPDGGDEDPASEENQAPYNIIGPSLYDYEFDYGVATSFFLETASPGSQLDPDGDSVQFDFDSLPEGFSLDLDTGEITILNPESPNNHGGDYNVIINVWTEDEFGLTSDSFEVTVFVHNPS
ncbi:hypothetical protein [Spirochaeta isovalerica]|uniref:Cadherin domain-containing protein n=1 Tax=Spirochaeta isovalerica TaxID=150 RepID=A0A841RG83_9SPIO|nr:hypothetical protein [Spirochaeta isovalerica]MBB6482401.1 hypothetical protein [Spirochaeta isovalerica]